MLTNVSRCRWMTMILFLIYFFYSQSPSVLTETTQTPACRGGLGLRSSSGPLERLSVDGWRVPLGKVCRKKVVLTNASNMGWGVLCNGKLVIGQKRRVSFISTAWKCWAICLGLHTFLLDLRGYHKLVSSDSMTVMSYINHKGGLYLKCLFILVERLLQ